MPADHSWSRRRLLWMGAAGLASVSGCVGIGRDPNLKPPEDPPSTPPSSDEDATDETSTIPDNRVAYFKTPDGNEFSIANVESFKPGHKTDLTGLISTVDDRVINTNVTKDNIHVSFRAKLYRDFSLRLHIRDRHGDFITKERTFVKPDDPIKFHEYEYDFDISDITLPRNAGGVVLVVGKDTHPSFGEARTLRRHQFVAIEHRNGTRWVNAPQVNKTVHDGGVQIGGKGRGYIATEDHGDKRTVFLAVRTNANGEVFGVSTQVDKNFVQKYKRKNNTWKERHNYAWETHYATRVSHLQELAEKTHQAISDIGLTDDYARIDALGDLIQMIPYGTPVRDANPPIIVLHETMGDCDETTALMAGILANDPWGIRTGYIESEIKGVSHATLGVDERDFNTRGTDIFWVRPTQEDLEQGIPDTRYAFMEMTSDWDFGERSGGVQNIAGLIDTGTFEHRYSEYQPSDPAPPDF